MAAQARARSALGAARAAADRGAMLRELCRLRGGYLPISEVGVALSSEDTALFARFGLQLMSDREGDAILLDEDATRAIPHLTEALRLDPNPRQVYPRAAADAVLRAHSDYPHYRAPTQKAAVRALATMPGGASLLATLPTGAGKSLLFQIAPLLADGAHACAVVIVPTVALALAHCDTLRSLTGLEASACVHSDQTVEERRTTYDAFARGEVPVLVLSPEVALGAARDLLIQAAADPEQKLPGLDARLTHFVIDEAHIIESWGRTFRPEFQRLKGLVAALRSRNPELKTLLLSATVNDAARAELVRAYGADAFLAVEAKVNRYEFDFVHHQVATAGQRDALLVELLDRLPRPAIVYTTLVRHAEALHRDLKLRGYRRLALFTGQMDESKARLEIVRDWRAGKLDLVIATSAFGMGIDKDDVRAVVHACVPESPSRYYQEIGRAARDGNQALALMLWTDDQGRFGDWRQARGLWSGSWLRPEMIEKRWRALVDAGQARGDARIVENRLRFWAPLEAFHADLPRGDTDYNRDWNRSLLNILQRLQAIEILASDEQQGAPALQVEVLDARLLALDSHLEFWSQVAAFRTAERDAALTDLDEFRLAVEGRESCVSAEIFSLVEAGRPLALPCGRCAFCRNHRLAPPEVRQVPFGGLDRVWASLPIIPRGVRVIHPRDDTAALGDALLETLVGEGVEQFVVPDREAGDFAERLRGAGARLGFVTSHSDLLGDWRLARLRTVLWLRRADPVEKVWSQIEAWRGKHPGIALDVVCSSTARLHGRPIAQAISNSAPVSEAMLCRKSEETDAS